LTAGGNWLPVTFAMMKDGKHVWIAHSGIAAGRVEYSYPRGLLVKSFDDRRYVTPIGIAVNPPPIPRQEHHSSFNSFRRFGELVPCVSLLTLLPGLAARRPSPCSQAAPEAPRRSRQRMRR